MQRFGEKTSFKLPWGQGRDHVYLSKNKRICLSGNPQALALIRLEIFSQSLKRCVDFFLIP